MTLPPPATDPLVARAPQDRPEDFWSARDVVDQCSEESFPASDPPSSWWGGVGDTG